MNDRRNSQPRDVLSFGPFSLFAAERLLKKADKPIALGGRALDILIALVERPGEVVTNKELISAVWPDVVVEKGNLRFQMATLRKALDKCNHTSAIAVGLGLGKVIQLDGGYIRSTSMPRPNPRSTARAWAHRTTRSSPASHYNYRRASRIARIFSERTRDHSDSHRLNHPSRPLAVGL
jgi:hypothetical protein